MNGVKISFFLLLIINHSNTQRISLCDLQCCLATALKSYFYVSEFLHVQMYTVGMQCPKRPEEGPRFPGTELGMGAGN